LLNGGEAPSIPDVEKDRPLRAIIPGLGLVKPCIDCGALVAGDSSRCNRCDDDYNNAMYEADYG
ncbi:MAG TPA: hypothetical protein VJ044_16150, partial [Candidatus Hodarchaeales archaeon]|nr:hypothetical protein [Candidatus Hodarchaeales archaeon]